MSGIYDKDSMKFETNGTRLDIPHTGQEQGGQHFAIARSTANFHSDLLQDTVARSLFEQANKGFDPGIKPDHLCIQFRFGSSDWLQL